MLANKGHLSITPVLEKEFVDPVDPDECEHKFGDWEYDKNNHWHECSECGKKVDFGEHEESGWIVDKEATSKQDGSKHKECLVCECTLVEKRIPATGDSHSSSSNKSKTYLITVEESKNGAVVSSRKDAKKDTTILLNVEPEQGYMLKDITVTTRNGKDVEVTKKDANQFTFKMPAANVTVKAKFEKASEITLTIDDVVAWVFTKYVTNDVAPEIKNERTMLPIRFVAEALGGKVDWDDATNTVSIIKRLFQSLCKMKKLI